MSTEILVGAEVSCKHGAYTVQGTVRKLLGSIAEVVTDGGQVCYVHCDALTQKAPKAAPRRPSILDIINAASNPTPIPFTSPEGTDG